MWLVNSACSLLLLLLLLLLFSLPLIYYINPTITVWTVTILLKTIKHKLTSSISLCHIPQMFLSGYTYIFLFVLLCFDSCTVTHGIQWSRLPWESTQTPWTQTWLGWMCWTAPWMLRDGYTATGFWARSGACPPLFARSVTFTPDG